MIRNNYLQKNIFTALTFLIITNGCTGKKDAATPPASFTERWQVQCGKCGGNLMSVKINRALDSIAGRTSLIYQAAASVVLKHPLENGLPDTNDIAELEKIEKILTYRLVSTGLAVYGLEVMGAGRCDFIFYTGNKKAVKKVFKSIGALINDYQIEFSVKRDEKWFTYKWYAAWK